MNSKKYSRPLFAPNYIDPSGQKWIGPAIYWSSCGGCIGTFATFAGICVNGCWNAPAGQFSQCMSNCIQNAWNGYPAISKALLKGVCCYCAARYLYKVCIWWVSQP